MQIILFQSDMIGFHIILNGADFIKMRVVIQSGNRVAHKQQIVIMVFFRTGNRLVQMLKTNVLLSGQNVIIRKIGVGKCKGIAVLLLVTQIQKHYGTAVLLFHIAVFGSFYDIHEILHGFLYRIHRMLLTVW